MDKGDGEEGIKMNSPEQYENFREKVIRGNRNG